MNSGLQQSSPPFLRGVIEGFFGKQWSWQARQDYAPFLSHWGYNSYIYAPKGDACLRSQWQQPCPPSHLEALAGLASHYHRHGLLFGIGLSPLDLQLNTHPQAMSALTDKLQALQQTGADLLCLLFDDMRGDIAGLAQRQAEICKLALKACPSTPLLVCPTYYSDDPILEKVFGPMPGNYLEDLGRLLPGEISLFWTGPRVISPTISASHLEQVAQRLQRPPLIWDNILANDGEKLAPFLKPGPLPVDRKDPGPHCSGQLFNPMNQPYLSQLPLAELALRNSPQPGDNWQQAATAICGEGLAARLSRDLPCLQSQGLNSLQQADREPLLSAYEAFLPHPVAAEVIAWLRGEYAFDPACLTD